MLTYAHFLSKGIIHTEPVNKQKVDIILSIAFSSKRWYNFHRRAVLFVELIEFRELYLTDYHLCSPYARNQQWNDG